MIRKLDSNVPPMIADFLLETELNADIPPDPFAKFIEDASCAGAYQKMSGEVAWRHVGALREETAENEQRFRKRFQRIDGTPPAETILRKASKTGGNRIDKTIFPNAGLVVCAEIGDDGAVIRTYTETIE